MAILKELYPILLVILFFCGSIIIHELGHYIAARIRGLYVPRFSIGFGPRLFSKKIGQTEFCISLLPLGGYVALPQLADLDKIEGQYDLPADAKKITFSDKVIVGVMGAVANIIFAFVLGIIVWFTGIPTDGSVLSRTVGYIEPELLLEDGTKVTSSAKQAGLQVGDEILYIDDNVIKNFSDVQQYLALGTHKDSDGRACSVIKFLRDGKERSTVVYPILWGQKSAVDKFRRIGIQPKQDLIVDSILGEIPEVQPGDKLVSVDDIPVLNVRTLQEYVAEKEAVNVQFLRAGKVFSEKVITTSIATIKPYIRLKVKSSDIDIIPQYAIDVDKRNISECTNSRFFIFSDDKNLLKSTNLENGLELVCVNKNNCSNLSDIFSNTKPNSSNSITVLRSDMPAEIELPNVDEIITVPAVYRKVLGINFRNDLVVVHKSPFELIGDSFSTTLKTLGGLFCRQSDISIKNLMGPAGLVRTLHVCSKTDIRLLLWFVILINVNLAILNMLPLPVLDGGCVALAFLEKLTSDKCQCIDRIFGVLQSVFLFLLLALLIYVSIFDIKRWRVDNHMRDDYQRQIQLRV